MWCSRWTLIRWTWREVSSFRASVRQRARGMNARRSHAMKTNIFAPVALVSFLAGTVLRAESELLECGQARAWLAAAADSPDYLKYAPSRETHILHLALD